MPDTPTYTAIVSKEDVTPEIRAAAEHIFDGWFADEPKVDWENFLDRLDGIPLDDGTVLNLGDSTVSPAVNAIKAHIRKYRDSYL